MISQVVEHLVGLGVMKVQDFGLVARRDFAQKLQGALHPGRVVDAQARQVIDIQGLDNEENTSTGFAETRQGSIEDSQARFVGFEPFHDAKEPALRCVRREPRHAVRHVSAPMLLFAKLGKAA